MKGSDVAENMSQGASRLGFKDNIAEGVRILKKIKRMGCDAFLAGNRISISKARKYISEHAEEIKADSNKPTLQDKKLDAEIRKLQIQNDRAEGLMILRKTVAEKHREIAAKVKDLIYGKLENEFPPLFSNDVVSNRMLGRKLADQILGHFQDLAEVWE